MIRLCFVILAAISLCGCASTYSSPQPLQSLDTADNYELLSLDPSRLPDTSPAQTTTPARMFHGFRVLGSTPVTDPAARKRLDDALRAGIRENNGMVAACFNPRHGIHATRGSATTDLLICFECLQIEVYENGLRGKGFLTSSSPQPVFDDVLRQAGVPLAPKP